MQRRELITIILLFAVISIISLGMLLPRLLTSAETVSLPLPPDEVDKPIDIPELSELSFVNTTYYDESNRQIVKNVDSVLVLVNKQRNLPPDYAPQDLVIPNVPFTFKEDLPKKYMRSEAAQALEILFEGAHAEGLEIFALSGYRSYDTQKAIFDSNARAKGEEQANKTSARPGQSEHQTGLAMDVTSSKVGYRLVETFGDTSEGLWLKDNAHSFGFIIRYPAAKEHITGYSYEPWHLRYVGLEVAEHLYHSELTLEEYFEAEYGY